MTHPFEHYLQDLVYDYDCVIIPGFGGFISRDVAAELKADAQRISPPRRTLSFNSLLINDDGLLINRISREEKLDYNKARKLVEDFKNEILDSLSSKKDFLISKIGTFHSADGKTITFEPDDSINYNPASFGLKDVIAIPIPEKSLHPREYKKPADRKVGKAGVVLPKYVKRTVITSIPVILFLLWGIIIPDSFQKVYTNYSGIVIDLFSADKPAVSDNTISYQHENQVNNPVSDDNTTQPLTAENKPETMNTGLAYSGDLNEEPSENVTTDVDDQMEQPSQDAIPADEIVVLSPGGKYFVIGGAFLEKENTLRFIRELQDKGFEPVVAGQNRSGQYRVSYRQFGKRSEAMAFLYKIQAGSNPAAWLLRY